MVQMESVQFLRQLSLPLFWVANISYKINLFNSLVFSVGYYGDQAVCMCKGCEYVKQSVLSHKINTDLNYHMFNKSGRWGGLS